MRHRTRPFASLVLLLPWAVVAQQPIINIIDPPNGTITSTLTQIQILAEMAPEFHHDKNVGFIRSTVTVAGGGNPVCDSGKGDLRSPSWPDLAATSLMAAGVGKDVLTAYVQDSSGNVFHDGLIQNPMYIKRGIPVVVQSEVIESPCSNCGDYNKDTEFVQGILYSSGYDNGSAGYQVNLGYSTTDSFTLSRKATIEAIDVSIWDVNELNYPESVTWLITSDPFGEIIAKGRTNFSLILPCQRNRRLFCQWLEEIPIPHVRLASGTYWIQLKDVQTRWLTWAYWGQSNHNFGQAYLEVLNESFNMSSIPAEAFTIIGEEN